MKNGTVITKGALREGELELINRHTRTPLKKEQVYAFTLTLCDNDIDRDFERFSDESLDTLCRLFDGRTGISDHSPKSENQNSRIFSCFVEQVKDETTSDGRPYKRLCARAYMLRSEKNRDLIDEIEGGIKKEVSVGCSVASRTCSICGTERTVGCTHKAGRRYRTSRGEELCHTVLGGVTDAYEWSFVAVPAQRRAGVTKSYNRKEKITLTTSEIIKQLSGGQEVVLSPDEAMKLSEHIASQQTFCDIGKAFLAEKQSAVIKNCAALIDGVKEETVKSVIEKMSLSELDEFYRSFGRSAPQVQLASASAESRRNNGFIIR